jgi:hypothetical protein
MYLPKILRGPEKIYFNESGSVRAYFQVVCRTEPLEIVFGLEKTVNGKLKSREVTREMIMPSPDNVKLFDGSDGYKSLTGVLEETKGYRMLMAEAKVEDLTP